MHPKKENIHNTIVCSECNGKGTIIVDMGGPDVEVPCPHCGGSKLEPPSKNFQ